MSEKPYRVKIPKTIWAKSDLEALDIAEREFGLRPKKAVLDAFAHVPRWLYDIAVSNGWCDDADRHPHTSTYDGRTWVGDGRCVVAVTASADVSGLKTIAPAVFGSAFADVNTAVPGAVKRRRTHMMIGDVVVDIRFARVVEHFHGTDFEWCTTSPRSPVFAKRDGKVVAVVMPMTAPPRDAEAQELAERLAKAECDLEQRKRAATQKADIEAAKAALPDADAAEAQASRRANELRRLAYLAPLLDEQATSAAESTVEELRKRLAALDEVA